MRAVVTGAAGFIGSRLAGSLLGEGWDVVGVDCFTDYYDARLKRANVSALLEFPGFQLREDDVSTAPWGELLDGVDVVFHQAGQPGVRLSWGESFGTYVDHNVVATQRLLEAIKLHAPSLGRLIFASSSSVYGDAEHYPTTETTLPAPRSPYGVTKLAAEHLVNLYAANFGLPAVSLRYFTVYGPGQRPDMAFTKFITSALTGEPVELFGSGRQIRDFTFVDDVVQANLRAAEGPLGDGPAVFNVAGGSSVSVLECLDIIGSTVGRPVNVQHLGSADGDVTRTGGDTTRAQEQLGWAPKVSLEEGIARQTAWLRSSLGALL